MTATFLSSEEGEIWWFIHGSMLPILDIMDPACILQILILTILFKSAMIVSTWATVLLLFAGGASLGGFSYASV